MSGLLVAAMTLIFSLDEKPSLDNDDDYKDNDDEHNDDGDHRLETIIVITASNIIFIPSMNHIT